MTFELLSAARIALLEEKQHVPYLGVTAYRLIVEACGPMSTIVVDRAPAIAVRPSVLHALLGHAMPHDDRALYKYARAEYIRSFKVSSTKARYYAVVDEAELLAANAVFRLTGRLPKTKLRA